MMDNITIKDVIRQGKRKNKKIDKRIIEKAYMYAAEKHKNQLRKSGEPYIIHPLNVAYILADLGLDTPTICAALLHDVVEDTDTTYEDIEREFDSEIAEIVEGVTKLTNLFQSAEEKQAENYKKMFIAMEKDIRVIVLKLADRLHNISTLQHLRRDRQIAIAKETIEFYAPIAHKLGMYDMKMKLQDESFKYLYPEEYEKITEDLKVKYDRNKEKLIKTKEKIDKELKKQYIVAIVKIETKHIYNIYKKITEKNITIDQIKDLFALKIITRNKKDCYKILGIINNNYSLMPRTFKDYISVPRNNMYQAIHEIILGEKGVVLEAQICSREMDKMAKYGITNYFSYVKEEDEKQQGEMKFGKKLSGVFNTLEVKQMVEDPNEFLSTLKNELFDDEVYVFTPKGDIKVLPKGSNAIDFAYMLHSDIGRYISKCKINSIDMPINTKLKNGNIVEIITSKNECVPKKEWLENIKTAKAKTEVMKLLSKNQGKEKKKYLVNIISKERNDLLLDITRAFTKTKLNIVSLNTDKKDDDLNIEIVMETSKIAKVEKLINNVKELEGIVNIKVKGEEE